MNICTNSKPKEFIPGRLYQVIKPTSSQASQVCLYTKTGLMVKLIDGSDTIAHNIPSFWTDVTDRYCLTEI